MDEYPDLLANSVVVGITGLIVIATVLVHQSGLSYLNHRHHALSTLDRRRVLAAIFVVLGLHVVEIWLFGLGFWALLMWSPAGTIVGAPAAGLLDCIYFSAATYTTVGFGDLAPQGPIRFLAGTEALTGFVLITWSASFTYLQMERHWPAS